MENIMYEVETNLDKEGGKMFKTLKQAIAYYEEQIRFCIKEKKEKSCSDFHIFNYIQIAIHKNDEIIVILGINI